MKYKNNIRTEDLKLNIPFNLKYFDLIEKIVEKDPIISRNILISGIRSLGKTTLIKDLTLQLTSQKLITSTILFTNEYKAYKYVNFVSDKNNIYTDIKEAYLNQIIEMQSKDKSPMLVILDNVISDNNSKKVVENLLLCAKEYNIYVILSVDYPVYFTTETKKIIDYVFCFKYIASSNIEKLHEYYFNSITFVSILQRLLGSLPNYNCLVYDNVSEETTIDKKYFFYNAINICDN